MFRNVDPAISRVVVDVGLNANENRYMTVFTSGGPDDGIVYNFGNPSRSLGDIQERLCYCKYDGEKEKMVLTITNTRKTRSIQRTQTLPRFDLEL